MHRLFGKSKPSSGAPPPPPPPTLSDATASINGRVTALDIKIKGLDDELRKFKEQLKKANGTTAQHIKKRALDTLKRKRMYEAQRDQLAGQAFNIEQTAFAIETVKDTQTTIMAMKTASKQLKVESKKINLSEIEDMQDDLEDLLEDAGEISEILGRSYATPDGVEEEDLEAELACLSDELECADLEADSTPSYLQSSTLPQQPTVTPQYLPPGGVTLPTSSTVSASAVDEYGLPVMNA